MCSADSVNNILESLDRSYHVVSKRFLFSDTYDWYLETTYKPPKTCLQKNK